MKLYLEQKQNQTLSPVMIQMMKILQMGSQELIEYVYETIQDNPVLDVTETGDRENPFMEPPVKIKHLEVYDAQNRSYAQENEDKDPLMNVSAGFSQEKTMYEHIAAQLQKMHIPDEHRRRVLFLAGSLNKSGYLDEEIATLASEISCDEGELVEALRILQSIEPVGIGARSLSECLCLQLKHQGKENSLAFQIVTQHLDLMAKNSYAQIARKLNVSVENVYAACETIRELTPRPGAGFADDFRSTYIVPDVLVLRVRDGFELIYNDQSIPKLNISDYYQKLFRHTDSKEVKEYLNEKLQQAKWVISSIEQRRSTLMRCVECIVELQYDFFLNGPGHLSAMTLADIAGQLNCHESTISRAVKDKYIQCAHGVYPFGFFFSRGLSGNSEKSGEVVSTDLAKKILKKLISEEDKHAPLSDQKLVSLLKQEGIVLSRRTVAKYRGELGIPGNTGRKIYKV